jgi:nucleoside-diphosphate-sugar epimerase
MNAKRCAVTGASGYLGSRIVHHFRQRDWQVVEMSRGRTRGEFAVPYSLTDEILPAALQGTDALIHCAHDFGARSELEMRQVNIDGSLRLLDAAKAAGVGTVIFISSMAAFEGCRSLYGRAKLEIEGAAKRQGALIIRPGTIYGRDAGGLTKSLRQVVKRLPVVPLIGSGKYPLYLAHEADVCELLFTLCEKRLLVGITAPINACARPGVSFVQLLKTLAAAEGKRRIFVPVPWRLVRIGLKFLETLGLKPGLRSDSITSLVHYNMQTDFTMTDRLGLSFRKFSVKDL